MPDNNNHQEKQPNILFITVDQMRYPDFSDPDGGMAQPLKEIFGFTDLSPSNPYTRHFPGFMRLRKNAVTLQNHHIAASACVPSRTTIYTGQYGTRTRVMETDSLFKFGSDPNFPWLDPRGVPTTGDWFRAAGYSTHYFGKWDLSYADVEGPQKGNINDWGFSDWKFSSPDAQGGQLNQLGVYRDPGYADLACTFLRRKAMNFEDPSESPKPWFATVSIVNPHDIASAFPVSWWIPEELTRAAVKLAEASGKTLPSAYGVQTAPAGADPEQPQPLPNQTDESNPLPGGRARVKLNPTNFGCDQKVFNNPASLHATLETKPDCQFDYSYKMGLALKSRRPDYIKDWQTLPFQTFKDQGKPELTDEWFQAYGQFYAYCHTLADRQIERVLRTLDDCNLTDDTIVVFLSDHGEYGGVQGGMIEKWHTAYDQILHVPVVFSHPGLNQDEDNMKSVQQLTSHIDILPTLLGFTDFKTTKQQHKLGQTLKNDYDQAYIPLPGANLVPNLHVPEKPIHFPEGDDKAPRNEILFITDDTITEHLNDEAPTRAYHNFIQMVDDYIELQPRLKPGPVVQPNHIRCIKLTYDSHDDSRALKGSTWKLARYWDPGGVQDDQWEFYWMDGDPAELNNLVSWQDSQPILQKSRIPEDCPFTPKEIHNALALSQQRLAAAETRYLEPVSPFEEAYILETENSSRHR